MMRKVEAGLSPALLAALVLALYVAACLLPALDTAHLGSSRTGRGLSLLLTGWQRPFCLPWSANLLLGLGLLCLSWKRYRLASVLGGAAALAGLTIPAFVGPLHLLSGYYFWQTSLVLLALGGRMLGQQALAVHEERLSLGFHKTGSNMQLGYDEQANAG
jgi:hypothetical protein